MKLTILILGLIVGLLVGANLNESTASAFRLSKTKPTPQVVVSDRSGAWMYARRNGPLDKPSQRVGLKTGGLKRSE